jgi:hypothetical protein
MKKLLGAILVLALVVAGLWIFIFSGKKKVDRGPRQQPLAVSKHSDGFNFSANKMMDSYYSMVESFVVWDSAAVVKEAAGLRVAMDSVKMDDFKKDTVIYETAVSALDNAKAELEGLLQDSGFAEKKLALNTLTQYVYDFLRTVRYDQTKIYFQECYMAFGEDQPGNWLSKTKDVRNPYQGTTHPIHKATMLTCGGPKDTLNFLVSESTK